MGSRSTSKRIVQAKRTVVSAAVVSAAVASVGIDISKETFNVALYCPTASGAKQYIGRTFANTHEGVAAFLHLLEQYQAHAAPLCMEATGRYWELLAFNLAERKCTLSVVNPARLHAYVKASGWRTKTDKADAQYIAHFCAKQTPDPWRPPTEAQRELQALNRHLEDLQQDRTRINNRKHALNPSAVVRKSLDQLIEQIDEQIAQVKEEIERLSTQSAEFAAPLELLCSIPGIGAVTAMRLLAELPDVAHFESVRQVTAYAGLNPSIRQSGKTTRKGSLSKQGNSQLRAALFYPALVAMRTNPLVSPLVARMLAKGKAKMQCVVAAMRKLLHIVYGVLKSGKPFNPALAASPGLT